eukprot:7284336-Prymnesium_polylepis.1
MDEEELGTSIDRKSLEALELDDVSSAPARSNGRGKRAAKELRKPSQKGSPFEKIKLRDEIQEEVQEEAEAVQAASSSKATAIQTRRWCTLASGVSFSFGALFMLSAMRDEERPHVVGATVA